jgi:hypothetical protein
MRLHKADGTPYEPESAVNTFKARFSAAAALAVLISEMKWDRTPREIAAAGLAEAVLALEDDLAMLADVVGDWQVAHDHTPRTERGGARASNTGIIA